MKSQKVSHASAYTNHSGNYAGAESFGRLWKFGSIGVRAKFRQMTKLSEYVKVAEAAEILGVSQGTVRSWAEAGKLPMHKNPANGYRLFRRGDLQKFLRAIAVPARPGKTRKN